MIPYTINDTGISFFVAGKGQRTFRRDFPSFDELAQAVFAGDLDEVERLANPRKVIAIATFGDVVISDNDEVLFQGKSVPEYLADRILEHLKSSIPVDAICAFAEKLMENPNIPVRDDLYKWLEKGNMPIYADGDFMAYKLVREDFTPIHRGGEYGQDQSVGQIVTQPRETCNENRDATCSSGLHFCSYEYLPTFQAWNAYQGNQVIVLKINPRDVVAIPTDYNLTKGRSCRFEVVDTVDPNTIKETFGGRLVLSEVGTYNAPVEKAEFDSHDKRGAAEAAMAEHNNVKTKAAESLGISRSTLNRWLQMVAVDTSAVDDFEDSIDFGDDAYPEDSWDSWDEDFEDETDDGYRARQALADNDGNKTRAAADLGISRSTLNRWLLK